MASKNGKRDGEFPSQIETTQQRMRKDDMRTLDMVKIVGEYSSIADIIHRLIKFASVPEGGLYDKEDAKLSRELIDVLYPPAARQKLIDESVKVR